MKTIKRRDFLRTGLLAGGALILTDKLAGSMPGEAVRPLFRMPSPDERPDIVTVSSEDPGVNMQRLLEPMGGIGKFVATGQTVGLLANSPWRHPGYYTNPDIVIALASLCLDAGAKEIIILNPDGQNYWERGKLSGNYKAMIEGFRYSSQWTEIPLPKGRLMHKAEVYKEFLDVDVYISVPVAKHHAGVLFSGNLKGMMGISSSGTNRFMHSPEGDYTYDKHEYLAQCIADLNTIRQPDLCLVDASVCGITNGPTGPGETVKPNKIIAATDVVAADVYSALIIGISTDDIMTFRKAYEHGLGEIDPKKFTVLDL